MEIIIALLGIIILVLVAVLVDTQRQHKKEMVSEKSATLRGEMAAQHLREKISHLLDHCTDGRMSNAHHSIPQMVVAIEEHYRQEFLQTFQSELINIMQNDPTPKDVMAYAQNMLPTTGAREEKGPLLETAA